MSSTIYTSARRKILKYVPPIKGRVLDVGCSSGNFSAILKNERGCEVHGIEYNPKAAEEARLKIDQVFIGDAIENLPKLQDGYYDLVTMNDVLEHFAYPEVFLKSLHSKLSEKGVIFAVVPNIRYYKALSNILYGKDFKYEDEGIFDRTHLRFFTKKSILRLFKETGYEKIDFFGINNDSSLMPWVLNLLTFGGYGTDTRYLQYVFIGHSLRSLDRRVVDG